MLSLLWLLYHLFSHPTSIYASVVINEVHPNPANGSEWVELFNPDSTPYDLTMWTLEDQLSSPSLIYTFSSPVLEPGHYLLAELTTAKLNNTTDGVTLKNSNGQVIDQMSYSSTTSNQSWSRVPDGHGSFQEQTPTPNTSNAPTVSPSPSLNPSPSPSLSPTPLPSPSPSPTPYQTHFQASEIVACPSEGETEWLEIFNPLPSAFQLDNWMIKDNSGNTKVVSLQIAPQAWGVFSWSGSLLNNTGDTISLLTPQLQTVLSVTFSACQSSRSFISHQSLWQETLTPTKGSANLFSSPSASSPAPLPLEIAVTETGIGSAVFKPLDTIKSSLPTSSPFTRDSQAVPLSLPLLTSPSAEVPPQILGDQDPPLLYPPANANPQLRNGFVSVIMGSLLLVITCGYRLYEHYQKSWPLA